MRITKVSVEKLFGIFDHEIPLNQDSRITIIHGPNGVGKTVLLNMLHGLFHYEYELLRQIPFEQFHVEFENGGFITVRKEVEDEFDDTQYLTLLINYQDGTGKDYIPFRPSLLGTADVLELVEELQPDLKSAYMLGLGPYWVSINEMPEVFTKEDMLRKYPSLHNELYGEIPDWFASIQQAASLKFVSTARLKSDVMEAQVIKFAIERIDSKTQQNEYISIPGQYEYLFPSSPDAILDLSSNLRRKMLELQVTSEEFEKLKTEGFEDLNAEISTLTAKLAKLDIEIAEFEDVLAEDAVVNSSYVSSLLKEHRAEQMDERESIHLRLEGNIKRKDFALATILLLDLINERFLFKSLDLRVEDTNILGVGFFRFITDDGDNFSLSGAALSSGEQHLFILYYYLLFEIQPDTLVLIDEPELSMNVVWQRNFLKDLQRIIELRKFDVLVATHSPQIIHDKWDWMVALGEPEGES